jgi:hypothetical protein
MTTKQFRKRLEMLAQRSMIWKKHDNAAYPKSMACYKQGYRQALRDARVDVFHVRALLGEKTERKCPYCAGQGFEGHLLDDGRQVCGEACEKCNGSGLLGEK